MVPSVAASSGGGSGLRRWACAVYDLDSHSILLVFGACRTVAMPYSDWSTRKETWFERIGGGRVDHLDVGGLVLGHVG